VKRLSIKGTGYLWVSTSIIEENRIFSKIGLSVLLLAFAQQNKLRQLFATSLINFGFLLCILIGAIHLGIDTAQTPVLKEKNMAEFWFGLHDPKDPEAFRSYIHAIPTYFIAYACT